MALYDGDIDRFLADRAWLFELSLDPMVVGRFDGYLTAVNGAYQHLVGMKLDEILERPFMEVVHPDDADNAHRQLDRLVAGEPLQGHRLRVLQRHGGCRWVSWTLSPSPAEKLFYGVGRDVTDRKETEDALARQAALLELAHDAVIVCDHNRVISFWNSGAEEMYGWSRREAVGAVIHELLETDFPDDMQDVYAEIDLTGRWEGELRRRRKDGGCIVALSRWAARRDDAGSLVDLLEIDSDITARKDAEDHLAVQTEELSRSNADLEQFASVVSHDLFQPLGVIGFYADLLADAHGDALDAQAKEFVARIRGGVRHMRHLTRDLLAYCRVGHGNLNRELVDCNRLVDDVLGNLQVAVADASVEVGDLPVVDADAIQLAQTFQNLIANAAKYARPGVRPEISVTGERGDGVARFCVADNGVGIAPEQRKLIFDMFERIDPAADGDGTGIGLAICARVVARHGGHIWVEDAPGQGSRFYFTLPA